MGPTLSKTKLSEEGSYKNIKYIASKMAGWGLRYVGFFFIKMNIAQDVHLFGIVDKHEGRDLNNQHEEAITKMFVDGLLQSISFIEERYSEALRDVFLRVDDGIKDDKELRQMSLPAAVALVVKDKLYVANVGDVRCFVASKDELIHLTKDHKPNNQIEKNRIEKAGGTIIDGRINQRVRYSRAFGDFETYKNNTELQRDQQMIISAPDIKEWELRSKDKYIILGSYEILDAFPAELAWDFIETKRKQGKTLKLAVESMFEYLVAFDSGIRFISGGENMICVVIEISHS